MPAAIIQKPFYYIRHGESEWNRLDQFAGGQTDTPLTDLGREQALQARGVFESLDLAPTHIFHSPLSRAKDTALILNGNKNLPMTEVDGLREIYAGAWAGIPNKDAKTRWENGETPENGENMDMFATRIEQAFNTLLSQDVVMPFISAHGRIINAFYHLYGVEKPASFQVGNCDILRFTPTGDGDFPWAVERL